MAAQWFNCVSGTNQLLLLDDLHNSDRLTAQLLRSVSQSASVCEDREENEQNILLWLSEEWDLGWYLCIRLAQTNKPWWNMSDCLMSSSQSWRSQSYQEMWGEKSSSHHQPRPDSGLLDHDQHARLHWQVLSDQSEVEKTITTLCVLSLRQAGLVRLFTFCSVLDLFYYSLIVHSTSLQSVSNNFILSGLDLPSGETNQTAAL